MENKTMTNSDKAWCDHVVRNTLLHNHEGSHTVRVHTSDEKAHYITYKCSKFASVFMTSLGKDHTIE